MKSASIVLGCLAAVTLSGCLALDPFLYTPERKGPYQFEYDGGVPEERIASSQLTQSSVKTPDGVNLSVIVVKASVQPPTAYAVFFHGKGNDMTGEFDRVKRLANMGYDVLDLDYRGFGTSDDVTPTEAGIDLDTKAVVDWWVGTGVPRAKIFYYSHSFGTAALAQRAMTDPPYVMFLESPFASLEEFKNDSSKLDFPIAFLAKDPWDTKARVAKLHVPLVLIHGTDDTFVRPLFSKELYAASPEKPEDKLLVLVPAADHGSSPARLGSKFAELVTEWVSRYQP